MSDKDRILVQEWAPLFMQANTTTGNWEFGTPNGQTDYRPLQPAIYTNLNYWVSEHKLDLSGYAMEDLTFFFRNSFEQDGGFRYISWQAGRDDPLVPYAAAVIENIIVSSVPFTDEQLIQATLVCPGFTPVGIPTADFGNFNRTHIIHGHLTAYDVELDQITDPTTDSQGWLKPEQEFYYSSLEPTAADCLYCYRVITLPTGASSTGFGAVFASLGAKRVIMSGMAAEEPELEYMMRLKRSYELANQV